MDRCSGLVRFCCSNDHSHSERMNSQPPTATSRSRRQKRRRIVKSRAGQFGVASLDNISSLWTRILSSRPKNVQEYVTLVKRNVFALTVCLATGILTFESSTHALRHSLATTVVFPMYLPHSVGLAIAAKYDTSVEIGNFVAFYLTRIYSAWRGGYLVSVTRGGVFFLAAILGTGEVFTAARVLRKILCREAERKVPTIESIKEALQFVVVVFVSSFVFELLIAVVVCTSPLVAWNNFYRFWGTSWMGVLAGMLTVCPALMHLFAWKLRPSLLRPTKLCEALGLAASTTGLMVVIFYTNIQAVIRPMPYLLFPVIILTAFRFNRLGCAVVVLFMSYLCCWFSIRGKGAMYRMAGSPVPFSSPKLVLQVELFVSVLGLVGILLAAAVREKKRLARDLHALNLALETTVSQRTQELVMANEELKVSQRKAEDASQAKSDFLANMSHEIRTPIHGVMGLTALLLDTDLSADQRDSLLSVQECANLLLHIINSILDLAKIEAGRVEVEFVPFNVRQLVKSTVCMLTTRAQDRKLDLVWTVEPGVPEWMVGDSGKIQQCLLNLVGNAVKFTHEGSVTVYVGVDLTAAKRSLASFRKTLDWENDPKEAEHRRSGLVDDKSKVSTVIDISENLELHKASPEGKGNSRGQDQKFRMRNGSSKIGREAVFCIPVKFEVRDTGIGIKDDKLQDIFTPFTQADASTSRVYGGTGLGLCIVQRFVELLGGKLQAESEMGKGSSFYFCVPLGFTDTSSPEMTVFSTEPPQFLQEAQNSDALGLSPSNGTTTSAALGHPVIGPQNDEKESHPLQADDFKQLKTDVDSHSTLKQANSAQAESNKMEDSQIVQSDDSSTAYGNRDGGMLPELANSLENPAVVAPSSIQSEREDLRKSGIAQVDTTSVVNSLQQENGANGILTRSQTYQRPLHLHVLLAEDNLINQKVATRQLQKYGYRVTVVGDGLQALNAIKDNHDNFDLILMDVQMPMMDGLESTRSIREEEVQHSWRRLPILGLTAHAIGGYEDICLSCGMDGYLGKPFDINQLLVAIDKYLPAVSSSSAQ